MDELKTQDKAQKIDKNSVNELKSLQKQTYTKLQKKKKNSER